MVFAVNNGPPVRHYGTSWSGSTQKGGSSNHNYQAIGHKRNNNTYCCDHCHMSGYTIDRCYKLHGYPHKNRLNNKRFATLTASNPIEKGDIKNTGLTMDQFNQLCALLENKEPNQENTPMETLNTSSVANVASTFCLSSCFSKNTWVINSGAITCVFSPLSSQCLIYSRQHP